jgi:GDPmannose 4,6-dehydratase
MTIAFVTGISGQDGGYLAERLLSEGVEVHGLVRPRDELAGRAHSALPGVSWHEADLRDGAAVAAIVSEIAPNEIYNLAGLTSVALSWKEPVATAEITGVAVASMLQAAVALQESGRVAPRFVQASSSEIFGNPPHSPQNEQTPIRPTSPYGSAKAFAHSLVQVYRSRELHASNCILYNHESPRRPETFVTRKITAAAARIAAGTQDTLTLGDVTIRRDWGWAPDYVDAMIRAVRADVADDFVVATGESHTIEDFVEAAFTAAGVVDWRDRLRTDAAFIRPADISDMLGDASKAHEVLGWAPTVNFDELVSRMVAHDRSLVAAAQS